jgi:hypothetical protein
MTQSPLGHDPSQAGPFDGPGPGAPDLPTTQQDLTTSQGASVPGDRAASSRPTYPRDTSYSTETHGSDDPAGAGRFSDAGTVTGSSDAGSKADTAKGEAKHVAETAAGAGKQVAETAKDEAQNVVGEAKQQAVSLLDTVRTEVGSQAGTQQNRIAEALHGLSKELGGMASASQESGPLTDLAQQASRKGGEVAHWLQDREPADVLDSVRSYGRRHPVTFLALCGLAGIVAGRLTRSTVATRTSLDSHDSGTAGGNAGGLRSTDVTPPPVAAPPPVVEPAPVSTGVYGGSVETTAPADPYPADRYPADSSAADPYVDDRSPAGPGYVDVPSQPGGDPRR